MSGYDPVWWELIREAERSLQFTCQLECDYCDAIIHHTRKFTLTKGMAEMELATKAREAGWTTASFDGKRRVVCKDCRRNEE